MPQIPVLRVSIYELGRRKMLSSYIDILEGYSNLLSVKPYWDLRKFRSQDARESHKNDFNWKFNFLTMIASKILY